MRGQSVASGSESRMPDAGDPVRTGALDVRTPGKDLPAQAYDTTSVILHWLVALAVAGMFAFGWAMQLLPKGPEGIRANAFNVHKSIGLTLLAVMALRLAWRMSHRAPDLPPTMPRWEKIAARVNQALMYAALFVMPLAGYLGSVFSGYPVKYFGVTLPEWGWRSPSLKESLSTVHLWTSFVLMGAVALHIGAALKHRWIDRDDVLQRMLRRQS